MEEKGLIYGRNPVLEYLKAAKSGEELELMVSGNAHGKIIETITSEARRKNVKIILEDGGFFSRLGPSSNHQGVALKVRRRIQGKDDDALLDKASAKKGVIVLLDQITDPHNLGAIMRSAEALGADGVIITHDHSSGINPTAIKSSAGATVYLDTAVIVNVSHFLDRAKKKGFWIIGTSDSGDKKISEIREYRPAVVVIGSEGRGMRRLTGEKCDIIAYIPLTGNISSLNASVAAGIILYEMLKA